ncbi:MAG: hypothetical protein IJC67_07480, partial [Clostridia bacterium]|nr:hypothetical protein [Clostridia bacterium]
ENEEGGIPAVVFRLTRTKQLPETAFLRRWDAYLTAALGGSFLCQKCGKGGGYGNSAFPM